MDFLKRWMRDFLCWKIIFYFPSLFLFFFFFFFFCGPFSFVFILTPSMRLSTIYFRFPVTEHTHQSSSWRSYLSVAGPATANVGEFHRHGCRGLQVVWRHAELSWAGAWSQGESLPAQAQGHLLLLKENALLGPGPGKLMLCWVTGPLPSCTPAAAHTSCTLLLRIQAHVPYSPVQDHPPSFSNTESVNKARALPPEERAFQSWNMCCRHESQSSIWCTGSKTCFIFL